MSFEATLSRFLVAAALAVTTPAFISIPAYAEDSQAGAQGPGDPAQRGVAGKAIDRVRDAAKTATDILSRVPCRTPKGGTKAMGTLPHVAGKLAAHQPVVIVAFGSSSTQGHGSTSPEFNYPNRLAAQLRRAYPGADLTVLNRGKGGEDAPEMMARLRRPCRD